MRLVREHELHDLVLEQDALVAQLVSEREHARGMYDSLNAEVGFGLSLIGPHGALPEDLQRALLALSAKPDLSRSLFAGAARAYRAVRARGTSPRAARTARADAYGKRRECGNPRLRAHRRDQVPVYPL